ncbi:hypothetical protein ACI01nite_23950 [Acetobacter cibinongensis]|uniref:Uncharacterized protein n=1 Tax=Acetobacter cibinongensis TaxID=146475 RepID=A0A0D6N4F3_9PROT|nr:hypothetical protein Abci_014_007 [Acetobacter cibinongensis]GEL59793.1 hypothetical protein ACI01nite_23950 [Acetobacter cibinongensis]
MMNTSIPVTTGKVIYLLAGRADTGQMCSRNKVSLPLQAQYCGQSTRLRGSTRPVGDRDKARRKRCQALDTVPEPLFHWGSARWNKLKGQDRD